MRSKMPKVFAVTAAAAELERSRLLALWRAIGYAVIVVPFVFLVVSAWLYPEFNNNTPDWKSVLAQADASWKKGDLYEARHLYVQVERIAASQQDWRGLVAAACGIKRLDGARGVTSKAFQVLFRALIEARSKQSREGVSAIADIFNGMGEPNAAEMALAQIRNDWPQLANYPDPAKC